MTAYIASSASVGRRPRISRMRAYSSSFKPSSRYGWGCSGVAPALATVSAGATVVTPSAYVRHSPHPESPARCSHRARSLLAGGQLDDAHEEVVDLADRLDEPVEVDGLRDV